MHPIVGANLCSWDVDVLENTEIDVHPVLLVHFVDVDVVVLYPETCVERVLDVNRCAFCPLLL